MKRLTAEYWEEAFEIKFKYLHTSLKARLKKFFRGILMQEGETQPTEREQQIYNKGRDDGYTQALDEVLTAIQELEKINEQKEIN